MKIGQAEAYLLRAVSAEAQAQQLSAEIAKQGVLQAFAQFGLDPQRHAVVTHDGGPHPVGTVLDARTGQPVHDPPAQSAGVAPSVPDAQTGKRKPRVS